MKKLTLLLAAVLCAVTFYAQQIPPSSVKGENTLGINRDNEFQCTPNSAFSQVSATFNSGLFADDSYYWNAVADDYTASGPFSTIRFWGMNYAYCVPGLSETFIINIYDGELCNLNTSLVHSFTKTATITPLGFNWLETELYQADIDLETTVNLLNGWVSISRVNSVDGCNFACLALEVVDGNAMSYSNQGGGCDDHEMNLLFCLGGENTQPEIPISNWALIIGIALIGLTIFIRFRRLN